MKKFGTLLLSLALALSLAGCGGGNGNQGTAEEQSNAAGEAQTEEGGTAEAESGEDAEAPEVSSGEDGETAGETAGELTTVVPGKLVMSTNASFPPYEMTTDDGGFEGIDVEIAGKIAEKLGLELQVDDMDFDAALLAVQNGKSDIAMAGISVREDRLAVMDFSNSYATGIQVIIVKEGSDVTLDNLGDHQIGVQRATTGYIYCAGDYGEDHVTVYDNGMSAVMALNNGQVDCVVIDNAPAQVLVSQNPGLTILDTEYVIEDYAIGLGKDNTALLDAVNEALAELQGNGTVQEILDKYISAE
ncbi:MAG: amino acid ABC transporter substrate-binding protein [Oscillibacter sp.]|nr:amino acid ABC transporter substrate-binding protein [Oscillibacter sp.]